MTKRTEKKLNLNKETLQALTSASADEVAGGGKTVSCQTCFVNACYTINPHIC